MKNFNIVKKLTAAVLLLLTLLCLTGCGSGEETPCNEPVNIAFMVGCVDDECKFDAGIAEVSMLPASPGTDYAFLSVESSPAVICGPAAIPDLSDRGYNDIMMERVYAGIRADIVGQLAGYVPQSGEIDMAAATELAVRTLRAKAVEGRRSILVLYTSGKSTAGLIDMLDMPVYRMDVASSAAAVALQMKADMSGIDVIWYCCGDFSPEADQPALSPVEKDSLKEFYTQLFTALGAETVTFRDDLPTAECYHYDATPVSCMDVKGVTSRLKGLTELDEVVFGDDEALETPVVIPESVVCYQPDTAEFLDPDAAAQALRPVADYMLEHPSLSICLYSTVAGDADDAALSLARSEKVRSVLCAEGVEPQRVTVVDLRIADDEHYVFGLGTDAPESSVNRKTVLMDAASRAGQDVLAKAAGTGEADG